MHSLSQENMRIILKRNDTTVPLPHPPTHTTFYPKYASLMRALESSADRPVELEDISFSMQKEENASY